ncbi:MAG: hypothetical protein COT73_12110, partial [Bdellovibrio sp. CG10_big_fil_rev_8_21_14_0_10_47_8]
MSRYQPRLHPDWTSGGGSTVDYRISYQTGATAPATCAAGTTINESSVTGTNHAVTGLSANTQYSFRVCAIDNSGTPNVASGTTVSATTLQAAPPNVTGLTATANSTSQITLSWTSGGGSTVDYRIAYASGATAPADCSSGTTINESSVSGTSHAVTGLSTATQYSFRVCAINGNGSPDVSSGTTVSGTTLQAAPPDVTGLSATANSSSQITLSWTSGGGSTADYRIAYATGATAPADCASGTTISESSVAGTSHAVTGLSAVTQYSFRVCAINGNPTPNVAAGVTVSGTTLQAAPPNVTGLSATADSSSQITLSWTSGGGSTADYRIAYASGATAPADCASGTTISEAAVTGTSHAVTGLSPVTQYSFRVCAINSNSTPDVASGATASATTPVSFTHGGWTDVVALGPKTNYANLYVKTDGTTSASIADSDLKITLAWGDFGGATEDGYKIYRATSSGTQNFTSPLATIGTAATKTYTDTTVTPGTVYYYVVRPTISGTAYPTTESYSEIRVVAPPANMGLVHRWIANQEVCGLLGKTSDATNNYRCPFTGQGNVGNYYDIEHDMIVDRFEAGCNYTRTACSGGSLGAGPADCTANADHSASVTAAINSVYFYSGAAGAGGCYINTDGGTTWVQMISGSAAQRAYGISSKSQLPPLVR